MSKSKNKNFLSEIESFFQKYSDSAIQVYRLLREDKIDWRKVMEHVSRRVGKYIDDNCEKAEGLPRCLVVDDSDEAKSGMKIEKIGKIYSHTIHKHIQNSRKASSDAASTAVTISLSTPTWAAYRFAFSCADVPRPMDGRLYCQRTQHFLLQKLMKLMQCVGP